MDVNIIQYVALFILFFVILYPYVIYPCILFVISILKKNEPRKLIDDEYEFPTVSVIVAAYNEEDVIEEKIKNTFAIDYPMEKLQIIIGSDGSTDKTNEICLQYKDKITFIPIKERQGKPNVINTLIAHANGEILFFSDANTIVDKNALKIIVPHFKDADIGGVCGRLVLVSRSDDMVSLEKQYWKYESFIKKLESNVSSTIGSNGGIYAMREYLYSPIPRDTIIDDFWISLNILEKDKRITFEEKAMAYEKLSIDIRDEFRRKVRIGGGNLQTFLRRPIIRNRLFITTNFFYYSHKLMRWMIPFAIILIYYAFFSFSYLPEFHLFLFFFNVLITVALLGVILEIPNRIVELVSYFFLFNAALFIGYFRYIFGWQTVIWKRAKR